MKIDSIEAWEVLDSRAEPTIRVTVNAGEQKGKFTVPSGASTGKHEALELRNGGKRYAGKGVRKAIKNVEEVLSPKITGLDVTNQEVIDRKLVELDGSEDLSILGANAILGVSGAVARAGSKVTGEPLYCYLSDGSPGWLPVIWAQIVSGGMHTRGGFDIQDVSVVPTGADTFSEALENVCRIYYTAREKIEGLGRMPLVGDEGGFGLSFDKITRAFDFVVDCVRDTGFEPSPEKMGLALDVAASHFYCPEEERYVLENTGKSYDRSGWIREIEKWIQEYPIVSLEDPLAEDDWNGWNVLTAQVGDRIQIVGDDLLVTNVDRLQRAVDQESANAILVKPNQTGTLTRTKKVVSKAKQQGFNPVISARSGETADTTIADLSVAWNIDQLKLGSMRGTERASKINRLLFLEQKKELKYPGAERCFGRFE